MFVPWPSLSKTRTRTLQERGLVQAVKKNVQKSAFLNKIGWNKIYIYSFDIPASYGKIWGPIKNQHPGYPWSGWKAMSVEEREKERRSKVSVNNGQYIYVLTIYAWTNSLGLHNEHLICCLIFLGGYSPLHWSLWSLSLKCTWWWTRLQNIPPMSQPS